MYLTILNFTIKVQDRNSPSFIAHFIILYFQVLSDIKLTEEETTSSGRVYIKYVFQELAEAMGLEKLYRRIRDP